MGDAGVTENHSRHIDGEEARGVQARPGRVGEDGEADSGQGVQARGGKRDAAQPEGAGTADEVAAAVGFLLSDSASFISGVALPIDGAYR